jgi:hypothetical protein
MDWFGYPKLWGRGIQTPVRPNPWLTTSPIPGTYRYSRILHASSVQTPRHKTYLVVALLLGKGGRLGGPVDVVSTPRGILAVSAQPCQHGAYSPQHARTQQTRREATNQPEDACSVTRKGAKPHHHHPFRGIGSDSISQWV